MSQSIQERAYDAWQDRLSYEEECQHEQERKEKVKLDQWIQERFDFSLAELENAGITARLAGGRGANPCHMQILGECPHCGAQVWSGRNIYDMADLGEMLSEFRPDYTHRCPSEVHPPDAVDNLIDALHELLELG